MRTLCMLLTLGLLLCAGCNGPASSASAPAPEGPVSLNRVASAGPASTVTNVSVPLTPGWNPLGLQCQRVTTLGVTPSIAGAATYAQGAYSVTPLDAATLKGRQGLMVFATAATSLTYSGNDDGQGNFADLEQGWNLVSFCTDQDLPTSRLSPLPAGVLSTFYLATSTQNLPVDVATGGTLKAGGAYWVFATAATRLTLTTPAPSPSPTLPVVGITLSPAEPVTVNLYSTTAFNLTATFTDGSRRDVTAEATWTSLAPSTAALLSPGVFKGLNPFATIIQASFGGVTAETGLRVVSNAAPPGPLPSPSPRGLGFPLIANGPTSRLRRFDAAGAPIAPDPFSGAAVVGDIGIPAVDRSGNVYFPTSNAAGVLRVDGVTGAVTTFATGFTSNIQEACAFDASGNLYVTQITPAAIFRIPPAGSPTTPLVTSGLATPVGLVVDQAGNLYVADASAHRVTSFNSSGALRTTWGTGGSVATGTLPLGLASDTSGRLYVAESTPGRVSRISADGSSITPLFTGATSASGVCVDADGNIYVQVSGGVIRKYNSAGALVNGTFVTGLLTGLRGIALTPR